MTDRYEEKFDRLIQIAIEHGEQLDQCVMKNEFNQFRSEQTAANEQMITILKRLDEERYPPSNG